MSEEQQKQAYSDYRESGSVSASEIKEQKRQAEQPYDPIKRVEKLEENLNEAEKQLDNIQDMLNSEQTTPSAAVEPSEAISIMTGTLNDFEEYPETPSNFSEGEESEETEEKEECDFADLNAEQKAAAAVDFLNAKRFALFAPGEDTRIFDFIVELLNEMAIQEMNYGVWERDEYDMLCCSQCKEELAFEEVVPYCPNCGAKMDREMS